MEPILRKVRELVRQVLATQDVDVYLFGSWAKGTHGLSSDIDVGLDPHRPLPAGTLPTLRERLEESHIPYRVEVVDLTEVDEAFRAAVIRGGIRWSG